MRRTNIICHLLGLLLPVAAACTYDNEEDLAPQPDHQFQCDTTAVTFSGTVVPILSTNCYSCHAAGIAEGGVVLDNYNGVKEEASHGHLVGVITHAPGFPPMPQGAAKLSDCDIEKIRNWVDAGAPNN
jgi:mono/diheme cytochrome c family protein